MLRSWSVGSNTFRFLAAWAGGVWLTPETGPVLFDVFWVPFLLVGLLVALLLAAAAPPAPPRSPREAIEQARQETAVAVALDWFFWVLVIGLLVIIILSYV